MKLLLQAFDDSTEVAVCAIVEIDVDELLRMRKLLQIVNILEEGLVKICFWHHVIFYTTFPDEEILTKDVFSHYEDEQWAVLPDELEYPDEGEGREPSTDCGMMVLHDNVVSWQAYLKHGIGTITTTGISWEEITKLKENT